MEHSAARTGLGHASLGLLLVAACAAPEPEPGQLGAALLGGEPVEPGAWPSVLFLEAGCTATLVHERIVIFAGHCGADHQLAWLADELQLRVNRDSIDIQDPERHRSVSLARCAVHPTADIGSATDVGYCELREPLRDVPPIPPAVGCERTDVTEGTMATLVGFGFTSTDDDGMPGQKRVGQTPVRGLDAGEFMIGDEQVGTCRGDSGGPAFVNVAPHPDDPDWRLLGVMSSGLVGQCGVGWYTDLAAVMTWLEEDSGYDLTPCGDAAGNWDPGPACRVPPLGPAGEARQEPESTYSRSCGMAYATESGCAVGPTGDGASDLHPGLLLLWCACLLGCRRATVGAAR